MRGNWRFVGYSIVAALCGLAALYVALIMLARFIPDWDDSSSPPCGWAAEDEWTDLAARARGVATSVGGTYTSSTCTGELVAHVNLPSPASKDQIMRALMREGWISKGPQLCSGDDQRITLRFREPTRTLNLVMSEDSDC